MNMLSKFSYRLYWKGILRNRSGYMVIVVHFNYFLLI
uniref:Uncharacterized protein n=1 Tax=Arundo donax TaxID=35708 RepID=A0A0A9CJZ5_ARUDO